MRRSREIAATFELLAGQRPKPTIALRMRDEKIAVVPIEAQAATDLPQTTTTTYTAITAAPSETETLHRFMPKRSNYVRDPMRRHSVPRGISAQRPMQP